MSIFDNNIFNIIWIALIFLSIFFGTRLMFYNMIMKIDHSARMLENFAVMGKRTVLRKIAKKPSSELREAVSNFMEFFSLEPVSIDPFGVMKKIEHIYTLCERRFKDFTKSVAPHLNEVERNNVMMGLSGAVSLNQIAKFVRHFVELSKKTKSLQWAMILQMQLPIIERMSKALLKGTEALTNGWVIGDGIGPLVVADLIGNAKTREIEEETLLAKKKIKGRDVLLIKAKGPGGSLGKLGRAVERLVKRQKIAKIITIDAAGKLEGEQTGKVAEGIGVAIGGIGIDKSYIENIATNKKIPLDTIIIKMSGEEAIMPMKNEILNSLFRVTRTVEDIIERTKEKGNIIIIGVGNTSGVGNDGKSAEAARRNIKKIAAMMREREKKEAKEFRIFTEK